MIALSCGNNLFYVNWVKLGMQRKNLDIALAIVNSNCTSNWLALNSKISLFFLMFEILKYSSSSASRPEMNKEYKVSYISYKMKYTFRFLK